MERRVVVRSRYVAVDAEQNFDFDEIVRIVEAEARSLDLLPTDTSSWRMSISLSRHDPHSKEGCSSHVVELDTPLSFAKDLNMTFVHVRYLKPPSCVPSNGSTSVQPHDANNAFQILMASTT